MTDVTLYRFDPRRGRMVEYSTRVLPPWPSDEDCRQILAAGGLLCGPTSETDVQSSELRYWIHDIGAAFGGLPERSPSRRKTWLELRFIALWHYLIGRRKLRWGEGERRYHFSRLCFVAFAPALPEDQRKWFELPDIDDAEWTEAVELEHDEGIHDTPRRLELDRQKKLYIRARDVDPVPRPSRVKILPESRSWV
jgi:hypothetical protein